MKLWLQEVLDDAEWSMKHYWPKVLDGTYAKMEKKKSVPKPTGKRFKSVDEMLKHYEMKEISLIMKEARKSPEYKAAGLHLDFWEVVYTELNNRDWTIGRLARKMKVKAQLLKQMAGGEMETTFDYMGRILAALEIDAKIVRKKD